MKKVFVFILLFSFSFIFLCGCGPLSPAPEGTVTPTVSPTEMIHISPTIAPSPTVEPTASPESTQLPHITLEDDYTVYPENYTDIIIDETCMRFVNIPQNLRNMGFGTVTYNTDPYSHRMANQYISYPVNCIDMDIGRGRYLGEVISYDVVHNTIVDSRPLHRYYNTEGNYIQTIYNFLNDDGTFTSFDSLEAYNQYVDENTEKVNWEEYTTISKEVNGVLFGEIYDIEYAKPLDYVIISQSGKYAFVLTSLEYTPSTDDPNLYILTHKESGLQSFAWIDLEAGKVVREYTIDMGEISCGREISISNDDKHIIIYFYPTNGGNSVATIALVIDIEASLAEETPEE